jgi:hypothetical protein
MSERFCATKYGQKLFTAVQGRTDYDRGHVMLIWLWIIIAPAIGIVVLSMLD